MELLTLDFAPLSELNEATWKHLLPMWLTNGSQKSKFVGEKSLPYRDLIALKQLFHPKHST